MCPRKPKARRGRRSSNQPASLTRKRGGLSRRAAHRVCGGRAGRQAGNPQSHIQSCPSAVCGQHIYGARGREAPRCPGRRARVIARCHAAAPIAFARPGNSFVIRGDEFRRNPLAMKAEASFPCVAVGDNPLIGKRLPLAVDAAKMHGHSAFHSMNQTALEAVQQALRLRPGTPVGGFANAGNGGDASSISCGYRWRPARISLAESSGRHAVDEWQHQYVSFRCFQTHACGLSTHTS